MTAHRETIFDFIFNYRAYRPINKVRNIRSNNKINTQHTYSTNFIEDWLYSGMKSTRMANNPLERWSRATQLKKEQQQHNTNLMKLYYYINIPICFRLYCIYCKSFSIHTDRVSLNAFAFHSYLCLCLARCALPHLRVLRTFLNQLPFISCLARSFIFHVKSRTKPSRLHVVIFSIYIIPFQIIALFVDVSFVLFAFYFSFRFCFVITH